MESYTWLAMRYLNGVGNSLGCRTATRSLQEVSWLVNLYLTVLVALTFSACAAVLSCPHCPDRGTTNNQSTEPPTCNSTHTSSFACLFARPRLARTSQTVFPNQYRSMRRALLAHRLRESLHLAYISMLGRRERRRCKGTYQSRIHMIAVVLKTVDQEFVCERWREKVWSGLLVLVGFWPAILAR